MTTVVVKLGGNALESSSNQPAALRALAIDLLALQSSGHRVVLVHGGGPRIADHLAKMGLPSRFVDGLRVTSAEVLEVVTDTLSGLSTTIVANLVANGCPAVVVSSVSAGLIQGVVADGPWGLVADHLTVNPSLLDTLWQAGYLPVVASVVADAEGQILNANADAVAGALAAACGAETMVLLSDVTHLRSDPDDPASVVAMATVAQVSAMIDSGVIRDGMVPKMRAATMAVHAGARRVVLADGSAPGALQAALHGGAGTEITA